MALNDGYIIYTQLVEIDSRTGKPTGRIKSNIPSDPNYIPPAINTDACPIGVEPVFPTYEINVIILPGFTTDIILNYGGSSTDTSASGTWTIVDRIYDSVQFNTTATDPDVPAYIVKIVYQDGTSKQVTVSGATNIEIPGPFTAIQTIEMLNVPGDFDDDYANDYYN